MTPSSQERLDELVRLVRQGEKYSSIDESVITSIGKTEMEKRRSLKEAVKSTRNKLHRVGAAYQEKPIPYPEWKKELNSLPSDLKAPEVSSFLCRCMEAHASTAERLPIHQTFFSQTLAGLQPIESILDLACGLNPLNLPWMPLAENCTYTACDIYTDLTAFLQDFFDHFCVCGNVFPCDLTKTIPEKPVQLAMLLKTIPCLEQIDKSAGRVLLEKVNAEYVLVSFPAHSLGGRSKGMVQNYEAHFKHLIEGKNWQVRRFEFSGELAFLVQK